MSETAPLIKRSGQHMTPQQESNFEEHMEGASVGSIDDWEMELGAKILKIEGLIVKAEAAPAEHRNIAVITMMRNKLVALNASIEFLQENPKAAIVIGGKGGVKAIIAYITKVAQEDLTRDEMKKYVDKVKPRLPGYNLAQAAIRQGGLVRQGEEAPLGGYFGQV